ncbi:MAG: hypothetical protein JSR27_06915 [Proteobacteria bacterium]|nr:hypothetical protein [Pseudomonadota bacterium]
MNRFATLVAALALSPCILPTSDAHAAPPVAKPLVAQSLDSFMQDQARIRKDMQPGGQYGYISNLEKNRVEASLAQMQNLLTANKSKADMPESDKVALVNAQEEINGILEHNDNNRLVCEHVAPVGSHRPVTTCHTYAEIMAQRERQVNDMRRMQATPQHKAGG